MKSLASNKVVFLAILSAACAADHWMRMRNGRRAPARRVPVESWENEGGSLAPLPLGVTATSQVPR
jgi:hypothetical protein